MRLALVAFFFAVAALLATAPARIAQLPEPAPAEQPAAADEPPEPPPPDVESEIARRSRLMRRLEQHRGEARWQRASASHADVPECMSAWRRGERLPLPRHDEQAR